MEILAGIFGGNFWREILAGIFGGKFWREVSVPEGGLQQPIVLSDNLLLAHPSLRDLQVDR